MAEGHSHPWQLPSPGALPPLGKRSPHSPGRSCLPTVQSTTSASRPPTAEREGAHGSVLHSRSCIDPTALATRPKKKARLDRVRTMEKGSRRVGQPRREDHRGTQHALRSVHPQDGSRHVTCRRSTMEPRQDTPDRHDWVLSMGWQGWLSGPSSADASGSAGPSIILRLAVTDPGIPAPIDGSEAWPMTSVHPVLALCT